MADIVYVSLDVFMNSFEDVADAIHGWSDFEGDIFEHGHNGLIVIEEGGDLYIISHAEQHLVHIAFRPFNLRVVADFLAIFGRAD